jgi:hypothetical protein
MTSLTPYSTMKSSPALKTMQMLGFEKSNFSLPLPLQGISESLHDSMSPSNRVLLVEATR